MREEQRTESSTKWCIQQNRRELSFARKRENFYLFKKANLPMYEDGTADIQAFLDEGIAEGKMLEDILSLEIIDLDDEMFERSETMGGGGIPRPA